MITRDEARALPGAACYDRNRAKIGNVGRLFYDPISERPEFASVHTGPFGLGESLVPVAGALVRGRELLVPYDKRTVKKAPHVAADPDAPLSDEQADELYAHYGVPGIGVLTSATAADGGLGGGSGGRDTVVEEDPLDGDDVPDDEPDAPFFR